MYYSLGKVNDIILRECFGKLITDEVVVTLERLIHILTNYSSCMEKCVWRILALQGEDNNLKNPVMTFYRIRDRNLKKLAVSHKILYNK